MRLEFNTTEADLAQLQNLADRLESDLHRRPTPAEVMGAILAIQTGPLTESGRYDAVDLHTPDLDQLRDVLKVTTAAPAAVKLSRDMRVPDDPPMTDARRRELLALSGLGRAVTAGK